MGGNFLKHNYIIYTYIYIHIHISLFTKLLRIHWKHNNNCNETTQLLWLQMHKPTHLDTPRREKMKWDEMRWNEMKRDEMKSCHVMLPCHVGKGRLWLSRLAISEIRNLQLRFHPHAVRSSLARTDSHGFLAPCWYPLTQGFAHTASRWGTILRTKKNVLNVVV